jgi:hypothetical protein
MSEEIRRILATEFSEQFVQGMRDRMVVSFYKYGAAADAYPEKVSAVASLSDRLRKYAETKNTEYLVDAANFAMIEFMHPSVEGAFFAGTDDEGSPGRRAARTGTVDKRSNAEIGTNPDSKTARFR